MAKWITYLILVCVGAISSRADQEKLPYQRLATYVAQMKESIPRKGSNAFREPNSEDRSRFTECMGLVFAQQTPRARACLSKVGYALGTLEDRQYKADYLIVYEHNSKRRGLGTYIVNPAYWRNVALEVPHPLYDAGTLEESLEAFQKTGLRALFITGTHRCANMGAAGCGGPTDACSDPPMPYRASDAAHFDRNFFTAAHAALLRIERPPVAVSIHGNGREPVDVEISDGTRAPATREAPVIRLRDAFAAQGVKAGACNLAADFPGNYTLCGESNVQGRMSNGSKDICTNNARSPSGLFIHIEQRRQVREQPALFITAIRKVFPADGPGAHNDRDKQ